MSIVGNVAGCYSPIGKTFIIQDEEGGEMTGVIVEQEVVFDAVPGDVTAGKTFASSDGVAQGTNTPNVRVSEVSLPAADWVGDTSPYSQTVTIEGVTEYSQVDLKPDVAQLATFHNKDLAFVTENEDGIVTVYAIGDKPVNDYVMQVSITEVVV